MNGSCLVLDLDGTILDTEISIYRAWAELWDHHGHELALIDWQQNVGSEDVFDPWIELQNRLGRRLDESLQGHCSARQDQLLTGLEPRPGVLQWLSDAAALGIPVGIASSSSSEWVEGHLVRLGLRRYISCLVCRSAEVPMKPNPPAIALVRTHRDQ